MTRRTIHAIMFAVFALLLAVLVAHRYGPWPPREKVAHYGFSLEEVARESGVDFLHRGPSLDAKLNHIMPHVAAMGAAVSVADFDRDGWQDLYVTNSGEGSANRLYRNLGDGQFVDAAEGLGVADLNHPGTGVSVGSVWGDYNNDGFEDLFVYKWGRPELFRNEDGRGFVRVTEEAGLPGWINAGSAVWLDYDCDGHLDLFIAGYWPDGLDLWHLESTRMMPESFEYAENGGRKYLLRNLGDGRFEDVADRLGIRSRRWTLAVAAGDLNRSGYPDLFLSNDYGVSELYRNQGGKAFEEVGRRAGVGYQPKSGMNAVFGDVLNQGRLAIYETNISEAGVLLQGNNLWIARKGDDLAFENLAQVMGVELGDWSFGAQFGDLNNDGRLDLYLTNGYVSASESDSYWYDFSQVAGGHRAIISDAKNWPAMKGRSLAGYQRARVWVNDGMGRFVDAAPAVGVNDRYDGRAVALVDLWNRGVLDVVVANQRGPLLIYRNTVSPDRQWIGFELAGGTSNQSAIGAQVRLFWNGQEQMQEVSGGSGFSSQNQRRLHFGLGADPSLDKVVVTWPSGRRRTMENLALNVYHRIEEP
ncbi:MAG: CRTAC1 family protein [Candidatus Latescibacteria bacterium]|nr:CRTAC1 family protein [Candidatus Latescibacterota bacterium]